MDILFESVNEGSLTNVHDFYIRLKSLPVGANDLYDLIILKNTNGENAFDIATRLRNDYFYQAFTLKHDHALDLYELYENILHLLGEIVYLYQKNYKILKL